MKARAVRFQAMRYLVILSALAFAGCAPRSASPPVAATAPSAPSAPVVAQYDGDAAAAFSNARKFVLADLARRGMDASAWKIPENGASGVTFDNTDRDLWRVELPATHGALKRRFVVILTHYGSVWRVQSIR